jgi:hypothetical protein
MSKNKHGIGSFLAEPVHHLTCSDHEPDLIDVHFFLLHFSELFHLCGFLQIGGGLDVDWVVVGD